MKYQKGFTLWELITVLLVIFMAGGWIANIFKIFSTINDPITAMILFRGLGIIIVPLGGVLGYM